jgi:hypothetical protein
MLFEGTKVDEHFLEPLHRIPSPLLHDTIQPLDLVAPVFPKGCLYSASGKTRFCVVQPGG